MIMTVVKIILILIVMMMTVVKIIMIVVMMMMTVTMVSSKSPLSLRSPNETVDSAVRHHIDDDTGEDDGEA